MLSLHRSFFLAIAALVVTSSVASDEPIPETERPHTIEWPGVPRPASEVFYIEVEEDGMTEKRMAIDCGKFALLTTNYGNWEKTNDANPRYSIQLSPKGNHDIQFALSRFPENEFLASLENEQWSGYIESLKQHPLPRIIRHQRYSVERKAAPIVLNELPYRALEYEYADSEGSFTKAYELFAFINGDLFVFTLSGPSILVPQYREQVNLMISRMYKL